MECTHPQLLGDRAPGPAGFGPHSVLPATSISRQGGGVNRSPSFLSGFSTCPPASGMRVARFSGD
jgi:hypothetical protein